ncbi:ATP-binding cassette domain-containing protein [Metallumcola ferriviriculae]|uniref:ATP-binding cassette domain-containing protein n=1 Tax=Metallumcola ferriviriculae TaxID=3039180 RepID=A0AAU0URB5_9FIRM|nr:ATP-binding cassette domain-containing protein [Desulfitibacteraceae bacterium MK1]
MTEALIKVRNLKKYFPVSKGMLAPKSYLRAVDGVSFNIVKGETLGLVGESGCGKTTVGRTIIRLYQPTDGKVLYKGKNIFDMKGKEAASLNRSMQMIFQDPYAALNPRMTVSDIIGEALDIHKLAQGKERTKRIHHLLEMVGLNREHASRFPHEFSGGQRQRIGIARALAVEPKFIICDEPISGLDVSIQAQVVNLLEKLQQELGLTYLFIAHDLAMVKHISSRVAVMYLGRMIELAANDELYSNPLHPYTKALLSAIPIPDPDRAAAKQRQRLAGEMTSVISPASGCSFVNRCPIAKDICKNKTPALKDAGGGHLVACHFPGNLLLR